MKSYWSAAPTVLFCGDAADLSGADLADANLQDALLSGVDLKGVNLSGADLRRITMSPDFSDAVPSGWRGKAQYDCNTVDFSLFKGSDDFPFLPEGAVGTDLEGADLSDTKMQEADVSGTNLRGSDLTGANLRDAVLKAADLEGAVLKDANLEDADLGRANLANAGITSEQLKEASYLGGATLPDGTIRVMSLQDTAGPDGAISHGLYATEEFEPALSFTLSEGSWRLSYPDTNDALSIEGQEGNQLTFTTPSKVFDPENPRKWQEAPENTDEWIS